MVEEQPPLVPHPRAPVFFLSYAQSAANDWVPQFFEELSDHVGELMGKPASFVGFMNSEMRTGTDWSEELAFAVGHCQVFVALLSQRYYGSKYCALEWHAFARRMPDVSPAPRSTAMLPVLWSKGRGAVPAKIDRLQRFLPSPPPPDIQRRYGKEGVYGLRIADSSAYDLVVWRLANTIVELADNHHVPPSDATDFEGLPDAFEGDLS
ncbi:TIR-like protein FxsC [Dactylosporangium sp. NPDC005572]|uniref:TIR-like protein FxsC n=1 Tax=Dactylosporangium sp. NPDC005572 TaxID=3156889 RepID=UPI0033BF1F85